MLRLIRIFLLGGHVTNGWVVSLLMRARWGQRWYNREPGQRAIRKWARRFSKILGLQIDVRGVPKTNLPILYIANHISWLDIVALSSIIDTRFIAKSEVRSWPLFGQLAARAGTLFINRQQKTAIREAVDAVETVLAGQDSVIVFPEGTTTSGLRVQRFHGGLFQAAINNGVPLQVVGLRYYRDSSVDMLAPFIGDDTFLRHLLRILAAPQTSVTITFGQVFSTAGSTRRELAGKAHQLICDLLVQIPEPIAS